jgi:hypothetical protein
VESIREQLLATHHSTAPQHSTTAQHHSHLPWSSLPSLVSSLHYLDTHVLEDLKQYEVEATPVALVSLVSTGSGVCGMASMCMYTCMGLSLSWINRALVLREC